MFIVMDFYDGETLKKAIERGPLTTHDAVDLAIQILQGLTKAHEHGIVHRDIKPANIMVTTDGVAKIVDFGVATLSGQIRSTRVGSTIGTVAYMSPEQFRSEDIDHRTDVFSFGVVLYELLTSHLPFRGEFEAALSYSVLNDPPLPVASFTKAVPLTLERIITRCLEKEKSRRYQSAAEIAADLKDVAWDQAGPERETSVNPGARQVISKPSFWVSVAFSLLVMAVLLYLYLPRSTPLPPTAKSIAVLPFQNLSDSKEDEYFSDGVTDDIIAQLSKITELKVISRTSVMKYKGLTKNVREIGKDLDVVTLLEGSVRRSGNRVRIVAQLIDATNEGHLWVETYDKELTEVFSVQSDVAQQIAAALQATLSPSEKGRIEKKQTSDTEAYQLYLRGRFYWNKRRLEDVMTAIGYLRQAVDRDPRYALAYAGLGSAYVLLPAHGVPQPKEWDDKARDVAMKALRIDSSLSEAHAVLGVIASDREYDWNGAERHFRRAIELDPNYPTAHHWYSSTLQYLGRFDEALLEAKRALELDPLSLIINTNLADLYYAMRQYEKSIEQSERTLALDQNFPWVHLTLASAYGAQGRHDKAIAEAEESGRLGGTSPVSIAYVGRAYAAAGRRNDALKVLEQLLHLEQRGNAVCTGIAFIYHKLGDNGRAFEWLVKAYEGRESELAYLGVDPLWDDLRSDPRFMALLKKMGLSQ